jgi:general secretion pathway protein E
VVDAASTARAVVPKDGGLVDGRPAPAWTTGLPPSAVAQARALADGGRDSLARALAKLGVLSEQKLAARLAEHFGLPLLEGGSIEPPPAVVGDFNPTFLRERWVVPLSADEGEITCAVADPSDLTLRAAIEFAGGARPALVVATYSTIESALHRLVPRPMADSAAETPPDVDGDDSADALRDLASDAPVVRRVQRLIGEAVEARASDIHFEPSDAGLHVRFRIDGVLKEVDVAPRAWRAPVVSRLKIMAGLNIAERRLPQDGRIRVSVEGRDTDFRVATVPTIFGESVVLRILDREQVRLAFDDLGFDAATVTTLRGALIKPYGIFLSTGPTGSGKTTTLYAALRELNTADRKILTVEDPVEYTLPGINQTHVKPAIGYTFAAALRSFLRQDPDVLMVGEIRDRETAEIAIQAALTGHLLLSTLHTNTAAAAITRLLDMGIDDYLLTSTINAIAGQRLIRRLCVECRMERDVPDAVRQRFGLPPQTASLYAARGCDACEGTGYRGRTSIIEIFTLDADLQRLVLERADARALEAAAVERGMRTMFRHGVERVLAGETTLDEILRVTRMA